MARTLVDLLGEYAGMNFLAADTMRLHRIGINELGRTVGGVPTIEHLTDAIFGQHASRRIAEGRAKATINSEFCKLLALWRFACRQHYVEKWPTIKPPKIPTRIGMAWTRDELERVFKAMELAGPVGKVPGFIWWCALLSVLWDTGERITATLAIEWSGVDLAGGTILIPAEERKGQTTDRLYRIAADTIERLAKLPREVRPFYFPYHKGTLWNRYTKLLELAGMPTDRRSKFHRIRRSTASHYEAAGGNATELLGHTSRTVTRGYLDPRVCGPPAAIDLLFRPGA